MSAAAAAPADAAPPKGKKKLIIIIAAVALLLAVVGGGAVVMMKKKAAAEAAAAAADEDSEEAAPPKKEHKKDEKHALPTFVPLEPFVVNLADHDSDRFAQIGVTLEVQDAHAAEEVKAYLPAIRSNVLMVLSHKTSQELLSPTGKEKLAAEIRREACRPLGVEIEIEDENADDAAKADGDKGEKSAKGDDKPAKKKKKKKKAEEPAPVLSVNFSSFIIQ